MSEILGWTRARSEIDAVLLSLLINVAMFVGALVIGGGLRRRFRRSQVAEQPGPLGRDEVLLAATCVLGNALVMLGFGALWIAVLSAHAFSLPGMVLYLTLNLIYGVIGHLGVEPVPVRWRSTLLARSLGTSTFHARHHQDPNGNFGFYTTLWDRLFGTLA